MVGSGAHDFCWALFAGTFLSRFQCLRARQGSSWSWRVERREPFGNYSVETDVKVVLILEDNAGTEILRQLSQYHPVNSSPESSSDLLKPKNHDLNHPVVIIIRVILT